jgi:5-methylcytosine-specific restriction protein A
VFYDNLKIEFYEISNMLNIKSSEKTSFKLSDSIYAQERIVLIRDNQIRKIALKNANYTCENCSKTKTFETSGGDMYFEAHHIIPFNISTYLEFDASLDCIENLACLCPECHRKVHYSTIENRRKIIRNITKQELIIKFDLGLEYLDKIMKHYIGEEGEKDE